MRLPEQARQSVVYLGYGIDGTQNEINPVGTGFLVDLQVPGGRYLVTAAHIALKLEDGAFDIRMNEAYQLAYGERKPPGKLDHLDEAKWFFHPSDETVDVAVMPYEAPQWADVLWWPARAFLSEFKLSTKNTGAGDFAYVVGILHFMKGTTRNMPAVHTGHIVLMPDDERIPIDNWRSIDPKAEPMYAEAYLVQAGALPGCSGAPVFIRRSLNTTLHLPDLDANPLKVSIPGSLWLLGVWRGAWFGKASDGLHLPEGSGKVPVGIGTVVPAIKLAEVLMHPELIAMRDEAFLKARARQTDNHLVSHGVSVPSDLGKRSM